MNRSATARRSSKLRQHLLALLAGIACTLPVQASIIFPSTPLQAGATIPPNVTLVLDDSGSMYWRYLYNHDIPTISGDGISSAETGDNTSIDNLKGNTNCGSDADPNCLPAAVNNSTFMVDQSYATNGLYYNPNITYTPWYKPDGTTQASTPYSAVYSDHNFASGSTINLSSNTSTYYVPKGTADGVAANYYRYQILGSSFGTSSGKIYQAQLLQATDVGSTTTPTPTTPYNTSGLSTGSKVMTQLSSVTIPSGASSIVLSISGGNSDGSTNNKAVLYERKSAAPSTGTNDNNKASAGSITINSPTVGASYFFALYGNNAAVSKVTVTVTINYSAVFTITKGVTGVGCNDTSSSGYDWRFCTETTGTSRAEAAEVQNFANWYSFYQTRMKTAKAGLTAAFSALTTIPRVGFRSINQNTTQVDIPVATDDGLFEDKAATTSPVAAAVTNKTAWFNAVIGADASNGTPLRTALKSVGDYYSETSASGPYGPEASAAQITCRQNFTILTTDGYWNETTSPGVGDADGTAGTTITGPTVGGVTPTYTYTPVNPYKSSQSNNLADVAMYYWKNDLRTDMSNNVPSSTNDPAFWQHMTTFTISIGVKGTLNPATDLPAITAGTLSWPTIVSNGLTTVDDLWHAAVNGHGSFVVASDPTTFVSALTSALAAISERNSSSSNVSSSSTSLSTSTALFQSNFEVGTWTGDLYSYGFTIPTDGSAPTISTTPKWQASQFFPPHTGTGALTATQLESEIYTWTGTTGHAFPTSVQEGELSPTGVATDPTGSNYIMGDQSLETSNGGTFRNRGDSKAGDPSVLGDIVNSSPVFVAGDSTASPAIPDMVYVGANDGMMHAFNATTGVQVFAYVPSGISFANLKTLENANYIHQYFVDGPIVVSTKDQTKTTTDTTGKNILVGTLGRGGNTVYALDVSDPNNFNASKVLWEHTDSNIGDVLGTPIIAKLNTGDTGVIFGNGYNSSTGTAQLIVLNIQTGAKIAEIDTKTGTTTNNNGLAAPTGWDADRSGTVDQVYAGDLLGNLWEFDLSNSDSTKWASAYKSGTNPQPLYTAEDASGNPQPITSGVSVGLDPSTFNRWVFFGTGSYLTSGDPASTLQQTWYGLIDGGANISTVTTRNSTTLKQRTIITTTTVDGKSVRAFSQATSGDMTGLKGWYLDLQTTPAVGTTPAKPAERIVTDTQLIGNVLLASSIIPSTDPCSVGGSGYINAISPFTGGALTNPFFDISGNGIVDSGDTITVGGTSYSAGSVDLGINMPGMASFIQKVIAAGGTSGTSSNITVSNPTNSGRISWREILLGN